MTKCASIEIFVDLESKDTVVRILQNIFKNVNDCDFYGMLVKEVIRID